jgi:multiple sugar transport system ATP-binding protein
MAAIAFEGVSKVFGDGTRAVDELSLDIPDGEFTVLVGPSGSGKSTALRMVAGLEESSEGTIRIGERVVNDIAPKDRDIAMVFQSYALYPHMSVSQNMGFALKMQGVEKLSLGDRVRRSAERLGIGALLERRPRALSGGQRQRVALGRAIVRQPQAFLMDEPLSNLDAKLRVEMRAYLARLHGELRTTTLYVTHDQVEAMTMGDRVAVMRDGRLAQVDAPQALYDGPASVFVAAFIGSPAMNLMHAQLVEDDGRLHADVGGTRLLLPPRLVSERPALRGYAGRPVILGVRPEDIGLAGERAERSGDEGAARGRCVLELPVLLTEALGSDVLVHLQSDAPMVLTVEQAEVAEEVGEEQTARIVARLAPSERPRPGERLRVRLDLDRAHVFDADTEDAIR